MVISVFYVCMTTLPNSHFVYSTYSNLEVPFTFQKLFYGISFSQYCNILREEDVAEFLSFRVENCRVKEIEDITTKASSWWRNWQVYVRLSWCSWVDRSHVKYLFTLPKREDFRFRKTTHAPQIEFADEAGAEIQFVRIKSELDICFANEAATEFHSHSLDGHKIFMENSYQFLISLEIFWIVN